MKHISSHISDVKGKKKKETERGELMRYFMDQLNVTRVRDHLPPLTMPRMGRILEAIPTQDLYYLKSICDESKRRGGGVSFSKKFWWEIDPKKHGDTMMDRAAAFKLYKKNPKKS